MPILKRLILLQTQNTRNLIRTHRSSDILLIRQNQQTRPRQLLLVQQLHQFAFANFQSGQIGTVDDPNEAIGSFEVISPIGANGLLAAHVPYVELVGFVLEGFDVESEGRFDGIDGFAAKFFQDGGFSGVV